VTGDESATLPKGDFPLFDTFDKEEIQPLQVSAFIGKGAPGLAREAGKQARRRFRDGIMNFV